MKPYRADWFPGGEINFYKCTLKESPEMDFENVCSMTQGTFNNIAKIKVRFCELI